MDEIDAVIRAIKELAPRAGPSLLAFIENPNHVRAIAEGIAIGRRRVYFSDDLKMDDAYTDLRTLINNMPISDHRQIAARRGAAGGLQIVTVEQLPRQPDNLAEQVRQNEAQTEGVQERELTLEKHYYPYVRQWAIEHGYPNCHITGGQLPEPKWENPDLIDIAFEILPHLKEITYTVTSFEVTLRVDHYAVWQADHYLRASSSVYLAFAKKEDEVRRNDRVLDLAIEFGLGVLVLDDAPGAPRFREIQSPRTTYPPATNVNEIIERFGTWPPLLQVLEKASEERANMFRLRMA